MIRQVTAILVVLFLCSFNLNAQEDPYVSMDIPSQNLLKFNRFLINPTFSTVNEEKSYINFYHRNQWIQYDNTYQTYLASYSGRVGDRTGLGLSLYHQSFGTISNFGVMANYAYGLKLSDKTKFTFGFNVTYYNSGYDASSANPNDISDPRLNSLEGNSLLTFQPGFNFNIGSFDMGLYAENLFDYNIKTSNSITDFGEKTFTGHLMYTKRFQDGHGLMENAKLSALSRARKRGENNVDLSGSLILDLPKAGWIEAGYDDYYGVAAGIGFNLSKRLSIGYTFEKGISDQIANLGPTHEFSFAYSFEPRKITENYVDAEEQNEQKEQYEEKVASSDTTEEEVKDYSGMSKAEVISEKDSEIADLKKRVAENDMIIEEMMFVNDSLADARNKEIDKKFAQLLKFIKDNQRKGNEVNYEEKIAALAKDLGRDVDTRDIKTAASTKPVKQEKTVNKPVVVKEEVAENRSLSSNAGKSKETTEFEKAARENKVRAQIGTNITGVKGGYYVIANVYPETKTGNFYLNKFMNTLENNGLEAEFFKNPKNAMKYVYLKRYDSWQEALDAVKSNVDGTYPGNKWVFSVQNDGDLNFSEERVAETKKVVKPQKEKEIVEKISSDLAEESKENVHLNENYSDSDGYHEEMSKLYGKKSDAKAEEKPVTRDKKAPRIISANIRDANEGYYIIANVFSKPTYADRFVNKLREKGLDANYFVNPSNNYRYVYINKCETYETALNSYYSDVNDQYHDDIWIMPINKKHIL